MEKIKMTLMEKANYLRAEMDLDKSIIDWDNVEIIEETQAYQEAMEQNQNKLQLQEDLERVVKTLEVDDAYKLMVENMLKVYQNMEYMTDVKSIYRIHHYTERLVEKAQKLDKGFA